jgi:broad specificity phosphatase PhoE
MKLYIFRHGETYQTKHNVLYGKKVYKSEILPEGIPAIKKLSEYLKKKKIPNNFSSPFLRCRQTVAIVSKITKKEFEYDNRLSEFIPENETLFSLEKRMRSFYDELTEKKLKKVAVCTHGYPISALVQLATKGHIREAELDNFPRPGVLIEIKNKKTRYTEFN